MSYLTAAQFINSYDNNPSEALQLLNNYRVEIPSLFTTLDEVMLLGKIFEQKLAFLEEQQKPVSNREYKIIEAPIKQWLSESAFKIVPLFKNHGDYIALLNTSKFIATQLFEKNLNEVASLFVTHDQFMELFSKNQSIAKGIFKKTPKRIAALFTTREQFMALESNQNIFFISKVFKEDANRIAALFTTCDQFIELVSKSYCAAADILRHDPVRITALFTTYEQFMALESENQYIAKSIFKEKPHETAGLFQNYEQFMALVSKNYSLATKIFEQHKDRIAGLFTTFEQFMKLESSSSSLAQKISAQHPDRIAAIRNNKDTPPPMPAFKTTAPRQSSFSYSSPSIFSQTTKPVNKPKVEKEYSPQPASDIDYSFYLKCLGCLAVLAGGALLVVTGLMIASQPLALLGGVIAVASGISLYELCSAKDDKKQDDAASQKAWS